MFPKVGLRHFRLFLSVWCPFWQYEGTVALLWHCLQFFCHRNTHKMDSTAKQMGKLSSSSSWVGVHLMTNSPRVFLCLLMFSGPLIKMSFILCEPSRDLPGYANDSFLRTLYCCCYLDHVGSHRAYSASALTLNSISLLTSARKTAPLWGVG